MTSSEQEKGRRPPAGIRLRIRVRWGLRRIDLHERVGERTGRRLTAVARRWAIARAVRRVPPLRRWNQIPDRTFARYSGGGSAVRIARLLDLVPAERRILDVGIGHGYIAGVLLRDRQPSHYCGVELRETLTDATRAMVEANDLGDRPLDLVVHDILDLDVGFWRDQDPEVVLLLEVLEHLGDPAAVLRTIAAAVRPGTAMVFTVPLYGRLERVWGHQSVFDRGRLERLCRQAGLVIERAEPLLSTWSLVLARASGAPVEPALSEPDVGYTFSRVPVRSGVAHPDDGVRLKMPNPRVVRLDLSLEPPGGARRLRVQGVDETGRPRLEWVGPAESGKRTVYVLRPGKPALSLTPTRGGDAEAVAWIDVSGEPGSSTKVRVHRAAYIESR